MIVTIALSLALLFASPALALEGINCRTETSTATVVRGGSSVQQAICVDGLVLTGGGGSCTDDLGTPTILASSMTPDGFPASWICTFDNLGLSTATCECNAICCTMGPIGQPDPTVQCSHAECGVGIPLELGCSECVDTVCGCDSYCCTTSWDTFCIHEAQELCDEACNSSNSCIASCGCP